MSVSSNARRRYLRSRPGRQREIVSAVRDYMEVDLRVDAPVRDEDGVWRQPGRLLSDTVTMEPEDFD